MNHLRATALVGLLLSTPAGGSWQQPFLSNQGQVEQDIAFYARAAGGSVAVTQDGALVYVVAEPGAAGKITLRECFVGAQAVRPRGQIPVVGRVSSFKGGARSAWRRGIPAFRQISLPEAYPRIGVQLTAREGSMEKLFVLEPGAAPEEIRIAVQGAERLQLDDTGRLLVITPRGTVAFTAPVAYQDLGATRVPVEAAYELLGTEYGFRVGSYDSRLPLIIDPLLDSTYLGGSQVDGLCGRIALDEAGCVYVAGHTLSFDFPTTPAGYDTTGTFDGDVFVAKFDSDLSTLLAATFLGGSGDDGLFPGVHLTLDSQGNVIVVGRTESSDFPIPGPAFDDDYWANGDVFVAKLSPDLENLLAATYLGGHADEFCEGVNVDAEDNILISGSTLSSTYPFTAGAYDSTYNGGSWPLGDVFISKLSPALDDLIASTFLGGYTHEIGTAVTAGSSGSIYVSGYTWSNNFPTLPGCFQTIHQAGGYDAFVTRLNGDLTTVEAGTFLGAEGSDISLAMILDADDSVYLTGHTGSRFFPMAGNPYCADYRGIGGSDDGDDVFISRLNPDLTDLQHSTYLGGSFWETGTDLHMDNRGNIYVCGTTESYDFPTSTGAYDETYNGGTYQYASDAFVARLDHELSQLAASTFLGTSGNENTGGIRRDPLSGGLLVLGSTTSSTFPTTPGAAYREFGGGEDVFICRFDSLMTAADPAAAGPVPDLRESAMLVACPEPLHRTGKLRFVLAQDSPIDLVVCDATGRVVRHLANGFQSAGPRVVTWDGRTDAGQPLPSGIYYYHLRTVDGEQWRRGTVVR